MITVFPARAPAATFHATIKSGKVPRNDLADPRRPAHSRGTRFAQPARAGVMVEMPGDERMSRSRVSRLCAGRRGRPDHSVNFPLLMVAWKVAPALAAGNT